MALTGGLDAMTPTALRAVAVTALRGAGVSGPKARYLHDLADRALDGRLDLHALDGCPDDEVIAIITSVKGLGRWSAEMFLMFRLNRPDIFPVGDLGIVKGMQKLYGMRRPPSPRTMMRRAEFWRPYRSVAAWYYGEFTNRPAGLDPHVICASCNAVVSPDARFCAACGANLQSSAAETVGSGGETRLASRPSPAAPAQPRRPSGWLTSSGSIDHGRFTPGVVLEERAASSGCSGAAGWVRSIAPTISGWARPSR